MLIVTLQAVVFLCKSYLLWIILLKFAHFFSYKRCQHNSFLGSFFLYFTIHKPSLGSYELWIRYPCFWFWKLFIFICWLFCNFFADSKSRAQELYNDASFVIFGHQTWDLEGGGRSKYPSRDRVNRNIKV